MSATTRKGVSKMSQMPHQRRAHALLEDAGYEWVRQDGAHHNHYVNRYDQRVVVVGSPKNSDEGLDRIKVTIRRHTREREAQNVKQTQPSLADQFVAMADPFLLKTIDPTKREAVLARAAALDKWLQRVLEKHAPVEATTVETAVERIGFTQHSLNTSRKRIGAVAYREKMTWMVCLPYQLPANKQSRKVQGTIELGVAVEAPEEPKTPDEYRKEMDLDNAVLLPGIPNGKHELTDQQAAFLMMAESLGMKMPGDEAKTALANAKLQLQIAMQAVEHAESLL